MQKKKKKERDREDKEGARGPCVLKACVRETTETCQKTTKKRKVNGKKEA